MDIRQLQRALGRAASLFKAAGAKSQAQSVEAVEKLLADAQDRSVEEFVENARAALTSPEFRDLPASEVAALLREAGVDKARFDRLFDAISHRSFDKAKTIEVAALFTGARATAWSTKPQALRAIRSKFEEWLFLDSKSRLNDPVTPW